MSDFNFRRQDDVRGLQEPRRRYKSPVPSNLFQGSSNFNLSSLPFHAKNKLRDLINKIGYQIQYFSLSGTPSKKVMLTCNLCCKTLAIKRVDSHVQVPMHMFKLAKQCKNTTSLGFTASSSTSGSGQTDWNENSCRARNSLLNDRDNEVCRGVKRRSENESTVPSKTARNSKYINGAAYDIWSLSELIMYQNSTAVSSFKFSVTEKKIIEQLKKDSTVQYFDFLYSEYLCRSYFDCRVCNINVSPKSVLDHVKVGQHKRNVTLNSNIEDFQSLTKSTKNSLRRLFNQIGDEFLNTFCFLPGSRRQPPKFKCKICEVILYPDFVPDHLQTDKHQKSIIPKVKEKIIPVSVADGIHSSPASSNLLPNSNFESVGDSVEGVSRGKSAEAALSSADSREVSKSSTSNPETTQDERSIRNGNYERVIGIENKSNNVQLLFCLVCNGDVTSKDLKNHVHSKVHVSRLGIEPSPHSYDRDVSCGDKVIRDYYREIVKIFTDFTNYERNCFHIFYGLPQKKLYFYCKLCNLISSAESLELHVNSIHSNDLSGKLQNRTCDIGKEREVNYFSFATGILSQLSIKFLCEPCNDHVPFKDIANHVNSRKHSESLEIVNNFLRFNSFIAYKDRVVETLAPSKQKRTSDFEFFSEISSTKLHIYCKSCELLLRPEYLDQHLDVEISTVHAHNSMMKWDRDYNSASSS